MINIKPSRGFWYALFLLGALFAWSELSHASGVVSGAYNLIQQAGSSLVKRSTLNFKGSGVTCSDNAGQKRTDCDIPGGAATGYQTIQQAGVALPQQTILNFPANMACVNNAGANSTDCTPSGGGGGGGNVTFPADDVMGTDGSGNAYGPVMPGPSLSTTGWAWTNQGGCTITLRANSWFMSCPASATVELHVWDHALPASPYTITEGLVFSMFISDAAQCGLSLRESGTGKILNFIVTGDGGKPSMQVNAWTNSTTFNFRPISPLNAVIPSPVFQSVSFDGTTYTFQYGPTPFDALSSFTVAAAAVFTVAADRVGFACGPISASQPVGLLLTSYKQS